MKKYNISVYTKRRATGVDLEIDGLNVLEYLLYCSRGLNLIVVSYVTSFTSLSQKSHRKVFTLLKCYVVSCWLATFRDDLSSHFRAQIVEEE
jgi:hypothetical protein